MAQVDQFLQQQEIITSEDNRLEAIQTQLESVIRHCAITNENLQKMASKIVEPLLGTDRLELDQRVMGLMTRFERLIPRLGDAIEVFSEFGELAIDLQETSQSLASEHLELKKQQLSESQPETASNEVNSSNDSNGSNKLNELKQLETISPVDLGSAVEKEFKKELFPLFSDCLLTLGRDFYCWLHPEVNGGEALDPSLIEKLKNPAMWPLEIFTQLEKFLGWFLERHPYFKELGSEKFLHFEKRKWTITKGTRSLNVLQQIQAISHLGQLAHHKLDLRITKQDWEIVKNHYTLSPEEIELIKTATEQLAMDLERPLGKSKKPEPWKEDLLKVLEGLGFSQPEDLPFQLSIPVYQSDLQIVQAKLRLDSEQIEGLMKKALSIALQKGRSRDLFRNDNCPQVWKSDLYEAVRQRYEGKEKQLLQTSKLTYTEEELQVIKEDLKTSIKEDLSAQTSEQIIQLELELKTRDEQLYQYQQQVEIKQKEFEEQLSLIFSQQEQLQAEITRLQVQNQQLQLQLQQQLISEGNGQGVANLEMG